ncbi:hypothetical protein FNF27_06166 [Cafeteria roenbergensis]|uniref:PH domain-containing protein n=1 Tax=Cafeteria roenbergensis TaxID=33653 RepID=A0A5A8E264_CAFRO|nr:hypothetical protein FNF27_06166 [Cafeteria roenbergensis]
MAAAATSGSVAAESGPVGPTEMEGWLVKRGAFVKTWKRRRFMLRRAVLYYFDEKNNSKGDVNVACGRAEEVDATEYAREKHGPCTFRVTPSHGETPLVVQAASEAERAAWISVINRASQMSIRLRGAVELASGKGRAARFKRRFVSLCGSRLYYFDAEGGKLKAEYELFDGGVDPAPAEGEFALEVRPGIADKGNSKPFLIKLDDATALQTWLKMLKLATAEPLVKPGAAGEASAGVEESKEAPGAAGGAEGDDVPGAEGSAAAAPARKETAAPGSGAATEAAKDEEDEDADEAARREAEEEAARREAEEEAARREAEEEAARREAEEEAARREAEEEAARREAEEEAARREAEEEAARREAEEEAARKRKAEEEAARPEAIPADERHRMALRIRTFALVRTTEPTSAVEYETLAERIKDFSRRAEAALLEAAMRFDSPAEWRDERTFAQRVRAFLVAVGESRNAPAVTEALPEEDEEDEEEDEEAEGGASRQSKPRGGAPASSDQADRATPNGHGGAPPSSAEAGDSVDPAHGAGADGPSGVSPAPSGATAKPLGAADAAAAQAESGAPARRSRASRLMGPPPAAAAAAAAAARTPARDAVAAMADRASSRRSMGSGETTRRGGSTALATAADFADEPVGRDGRTPFEREVRSVIKEMRRARAEIREQEAAARMERLRVQALTARPANEGRRRYGTDHPFADRFRIRVFPSQEGDGDLRIPVILDRRSPEPPPLPALNQWQLRACAACGAAITTGSWRVLTGAEKPARYCSYTELLYCNECFENYVPEAVAAGSGADEGPRTPKLEHAIPWRVVHELSSKKYPVCAAAEAFLRKIWRAPMIDVTAVGVGAAVSGRSLSSSGGGAGRPRGRVVQAARNIQLIVGLRRRAADIAEQIDALLAHRAEAVRREAGWQGDDGDDGDPAEDAGLVGAGGAPLGTEALSQTLRARLPDKFGYFTLTGPELVAPAHYLGISEGRLLTKLEAVVDDMNKALEAARSRAVEE